MSERRYVVWHPDHGFLHEWSCDGRDGLTEADARSRAEAWRLEGGDHIHALVPLAELEAMERERAEMLEALKKTLEWFREENILEPQELSSVVIERMDKAIARAEGTRE